MSTFILAAVSLGLLSSLHCVGMCGPIALALPLNRHSGWTMLGGVLLNNLARISGYALLGVLAGTAGMGLALAGLQSYLSIIAGCVMLLVLLAGHKQLHIAGMHVAAGKWKAAAARLFGSSAPHTLLLIGLLNALLPCGFVYMALAAAVSTGGAAAGALFMACFGLGTMPALITVAFARQLLGPALRAKARTLAPVLVAVLACTLIVRGLHLGIPYLSPRVAQDTFAPCCRK